MPKRSRKSGPPKCLSCASIDVLTRGVCRKCYHNARNMIARGEVDEQTLIDAGLIRPSRQGRNAVRDALLAKR